MLVLILMAVGVVVAMLVLIYIVDAFVLRPRNSHTAERILRAENVAANENDSTFDDMRDVSDKITQRARRVMDGASVRGDNH
jgi:hypothetical protein